MKARNHHSRESQPEASAGGSVRLTFALTPTLSSGRGSSKNALESSEPLVSHSAPSGSPTTAPESPSRVFVNPAWRLCPPLPGERAGVRVSVGHQTSNQPSNADFILRPFLLVLLLSLVFLATGCDWMPGKPKLADRWVPDTAITNFARLYHNECAACHAIDGRLAAARPLNDPVYLAMTDRALFRKAIANGVQGTTMPAFAQNLGGPLTEAQIDIIVANLTANWSRPQDFVGIKLPPYSAPRGDVQRGAAAYQTFCAKCHGPDGKGGPTGGSVVNPAYLALVSDQGLRTTVIAGRVDLGMPDWRSYMSGRPMSDQEISDVVAWLASHRGSSTSTGGTGGGSR